MKEKTRWRLRQLQLLRPSVHRRRVKVIYPRCQVDET